MQKLSPEEIQSKLVTIPQWNFDGQQLVFEQTFKDFKEAFSFLTKVALVSERLDHHAEIWNVYNKVTLKLSTHDTGGVTVKDFTWIGFVG